MTDETETHDESKKFEKVMGNILTVSANEHLVMAQMEACEYFSPMPASFPLPNDGLERRLDTLSELTGGSPRLILIANREEPPEYDTYLDAAVQEAISVFMRARTAVCRTHVYMIGEYLLHENPDSMSIPTDPEIRRIWLSKLEDTFWEHAESSYIRIASYWDRIGQILDFVYFNIRQYERDGFAAVADRIQKNYVPINNELSSSPCWRRLRKFQNSENTDGLKWLLRRRNLLIHSLHLHKKRAQETDNPIFSNAYNHLNEALVSKLRQGNAEEEIGFLHSQLSKAASLFSDIVEVAIIGASNKTKGDTH